MKILIKTKEVTLEIEDNILFSSDNFTKREIPKLTDAIICSIEQVLKLHSEIKKL